MVMTKTPDALRREKCFSPQTPVKTDHSTQENAEISSQFYEKKTFNLLAGILLEPSAKRFASLSERQLDELENERHSKKTKDVTNCHKMFWLCYATNRKRFSVYYGIIVCESTQEATVHPAIALCDSHASFVLSNLSRAAI